ncbi:MAG: hypothetical protein AAGB00_03050, partial [Planctomycetota bacterium]
VTPPIAAPTDGLMEGGVAEGGYVESGIDGEVPGADDPLFDGASDDAGASPLLLVRLELRRDAIDSRLIDRVLLTQGISVESLSDRRPAAPSAPQRQRVVANARRQLVLPGAERRNRQEESPAEVLLVDAPAAQVAACLEELRGDVGNFSSVLVQPVAVPSTDATRRRATAMRSSPGSPRVSAEALQQVNTLKWLGYNREGSKDAAAGLQSQREGQLRQADGARRAKASSKEKSATLGFAFRLAEGELSQFPIDLGRADLSLLTLSALKGQSRPEGAPSVESVPMKGGKTRGEPRSRRAAGLPEGESAAYRYAAPIPAPTDASARLNALVIVNAAAPASAPAERAQPATPSP